MHPIKIIGADGWTYHQESGPDLIDGISGNFFNILGFRRLNLHWSTFNLQSEFSCPYVDELKEKLSTHFCFSDNDNWSFTKTLDEAVELALTAAFTQRYKEVGRITHKVLTLPGMRFGGSIALSQFGTSIPLTRPAFEICEVPTNDLIQEHVPAYFRELDFDAVLIEPVRRDSGQTISLKVLNRLHSLCQANRSYLIVDESHCCLNRCSPYEFHSDISIFGPSLANGAAFSAVKFTKGFQSFPSDNDPLHCELVLQTLYLLTRYGNESFVLGKTFAKAFPSASVNGSLIHIPTSKARQIREWLLKERNIVCAANDFNLIFAPCFTMPFKVASQIVKAVKEGLDEFRT